MGAKWPEQKYIPEVNENILNKNVISDQDNKNLTNFLKEDVYKRQVLSRLWSGIIAFFWWKESWIWKMILNDEKEEKIKEIINMIQNAVGKENTYLEIIAQQESLDNDLQKVNHAILSLSKELNVPCVVNTNYHYIKKDDRAAWEIALDIKAVSYTHLLYCVWCEAFKNERDLVNGLCPDHQTKPDVITEKNWFFKLSNYQDKLLELFVKNPTFVEPASRSVSYTHLDVYKRQSLFCEIF